MSCIQFLITASRARRSRVLGMSISVLLASTSLVLLLTGCGVTPGSSIGGGESAGVMLQGRVHGGQQPVTGATIALYAASTTGYPSSSSIAPAPLGPTTTTDASGNFSISDSYTCPTVVGGSQVYIVASGGNPGNPNNQDNPNLVLMAALGTCPSDGTLSSGLFIDINEVSTVASAYALAQFMGYPAANPAALAVPYVGTTAGNTVGLANAFATVSNLESISTGQAYSYTPAYSGNVVGFTTPNGSYVPQARINALANALAICVNSTGGSAGDHAGTGGVDSPCGMLFDDTPYASGFPTDTLQAILNLAKHPASSSAASANLYTLSTTGPVPFSPALSGAPTDWTLALGFTGGGFGRYLANADTDVTAPSSIAVDTTGNIWIASGMKPGVSGNGGFVSQFSNLGAPRSQNTTATAIGGYQPSGLNLADALAIDASGTVWVGDGNGNIYQLDSNGNQIGSTITILGSGGLAVGAIGGLAFDNSGNVWVGSSDPNTYGILSELSSGGAFMNTTGENFDGGNSYGLQNLTFDPAGNLWAEDVNGTTGLHRIDTSNDSSVDYANISNGFGINLTGATGLLGNIYSSNLSAGQLDVLNNTSSSPTAFGTNSRVAGNVAVDGAGNVWAAGPGPTFGAQSSQTSFLDEFSSSGTQLSPVSTGFTGSTISAGENGPGGSIVDLSNNDPGGNIPVMALDNSGNVWVAYPQPLNGYQLVEFVGMASPVITPAVAAVHAVTP